MIRDRKTNNRITEIFKDIPALYVADGHHRTAAAARVGQECQRRNPDHTGREEYCYFLAVTFPAGQLRIIDYNRVVKDLNGLTSAQLLEKLAENFTVEDKGAEEYRPSGLHNFSMYLDGRWYSLTAKPGTYDDNDPIGCWTSRCCRIWCWTGFWTSKTCALRSGSTSWAASAVWAS